MKKIVLDIHIYLSLFCAGYLVIYGLSSIAFNHDIHSSATQVEWQRQIAVPEAATDQALAEALRDALDLSGWVPSWRLRRAGQDILVFAVKRPGKSYRLRLDQTTGKIQITETRHGLWGIVKGLHGLTELPNSPWGASWGLYTEISVWALIFAVLSGFYFWWLRPAARLPGWCLLLAGSGGSILFILYIIW